MHRRKYMHVGYNYHKQEYGRKYETFSSFVECCLQITWSQLSSRKLTIEW